MSGTVHTAKGDGRADLPRVAVIGLGRFGRFWAELLADRYEVLGTSRRRIEGLPDGVSQVDLPTALAAEIVFLTVSIS
ncbi:MAG: hypothetical protein ACOC2V_07255, partial [Alkalispirochaeta sp.]